MSRDGRIELFERTRCGITRIGEEGFAGLCPFIIQFAERRFGEKDFPADFEPTRRRMRGLRPQRQGNGAYGPEIGRNVFARDPIPACRANSKFAVFIHQLDRYAVDLWLGHIFNTIRCFERALDTLMKFLHLCSGDDVGQRQHGDGVSDLSKRSQGRGADLLGRGSRVVQFRMFGF